MKGYVRYITIALVMMSLVYTALVPGGTTRASASSSKEWPHVNAGSLYVMDMASGRPLYWEAPDKRMKPASTTKIMTAILAIEKGRMDDMVVVSKRAASVEGSRIYLEEGEKESLRDLLYALMLESANDAAIAIAEHLGGSVESFAQMMNEKAASLGCTGTHFTNPNGLEDPDHYTTAHDLALIARYAMQNPQFRQVVSTREWQMPWPVKNSTRVLYNENRLLWSEDGTGVKTGYTTAAGHCMVASAKRGGQEVLVVLLGGEMGFWKDIRELIDYYFARYVTLTVVQKGQELGTRKFSSWGFSHEVKAVAGEDAVLPVCTEEKGATAQVRVAWKEGVRPPISAGDTLGIAYISFPTLPSAAEICIPVVAAEAVPGLVLSRLPWKWTLAFCGVLALLSSARSAARRKRRLRKRYLKPRRPRIRRL